MLKVLTPREREIIKARYGLGAPEDSEAKTPWPVQPATRLVCP